MASLPDLLLAEHHREELFNDSAKLVENYVARRGGLKGLAYKAGLATANSARPNFLRNAMRKLVPDFAVALDPLYQEFLAGSSADFSVFLQRHAERAVPALLAVTDGRVANTDHKSLQALYNKLRKGVEEDMEALLPDLARLLTTYAA